MNKVKTRKLNYWLTLEIVFFGIEFDKLSYSLNNWKLKGVIRKDLNMFMRL